MLRQIAKNVFNIVRIWPLWCFVDTLAGLSSALTVILGCACACLFFLYFLCYLCIPSQVFILDPTSEDGKDLMEYVKLFLDHLVPARFGVLLAPQESSEVGVALCRGFSYLSVHESPRQALTWLYKVMLAPCVCQIYVCFFFCYRRFRVHLQWTA